MTDRELMQMALHGLEMVSAIDRRFSQRECVRLLRERLSQPEPEPTQYAGNGTAGRENMTAPTGFFFQMPKREWVGLTEADIYDAMDNEDEFDFAEAIEAKLKEKNT